MAGDDRARHRLLVKLQEVLGEKDAATLMEHLPPDRWHELATKRDLAGQLEQIDRRFEQVDHRFALLEQRFDAAERRTDDRFSAFAAHLDAQLDHQHDRLLVALHERMDRQTRLLLFTILGALVTMALVGVTGG